MPSSIFSSRLPWGFLGALPLIALLELFAASAPFPVSETSIRQKAAAADRPPTTDILVTGDCTSWAGIRPRALEANLGARSFNLATNVAQTELINYLLVKRFVENSPTPPRIVVIGVSAWSLIGGHDRGENWLLSQVLPYFRVDRDFIEELSPEMRAFYQEEEIRRYFMPPSVRRQYIFKDAFSPGLQQMADEIEAEAGWFNEDLLGTRRAPREITEIGPEFQEVIWSDFNASYRKKLLGFLEGRGIKVVVCMMPITPSELRVWKKHGVREKITERLSGELNGRTNVVGLWDMLDAVPAEERFVDGIHLDAEGAALFTDTLSKRLEPYLKS